jgi:hypothetical protein
MTESIILFFLHMSSYYYLHLLRPQRAFLPVRTLAVGVNRQLPLTPLGIEVRMCARIFRPHLRHPLPGVPGLGELPADCTFHGNISCNFLALGMSSRRLDYPRGMRTSGSSRCRRTDRQWSGANAAYTCAQTYNDYTMIMPNLWSVSGRQLGCRRSVSTS